jgi:rubrerythrin
MATFVLILVIGLPILFQLVKTIDRIDKQNKRRAKRKTRSSSSGPTRPRQNRDFEEADITNRIRIVQESCEIINESKNLYTRLSRCNVALQNLEKLLDYERKGILTGENNCTQLKQDMEQIKAELETDVNLIKDILTERKAKDPESVLCPYCAYRFEETPSRKRKCPSCKQTIIRFKSNEKVIYLLDEDSAEKIRKLETRVINQGGDYEKDL